MSQPALSSREWLETDGLGGFASGTMTGLRTRRYHALLLTATTPPTGRMVLVNGLEAWVEIDGTILPLTSQCYAPGVLDGPGASRIEQFTWQPWPRWKFQLTKDTFLQLELFCVKGAPVTCLAWTLHGPHRQVHLHVRPFLSGRDYHSLHHCNPAFRFDVESGPGRVTWHPYPDVPAVTVLSNASYEHQPLWYYRFLYEEELARGLEAEEDLAAPGIFTWDLTAGRAVMLLTTRDHARHAWPTHSQPTGLWQTLRDLEQTRRAQFPTPLHQAADAYLVTAQPRGQASGGQTLIAGYPWFTDWGRDTFIALRGLCLATGQLEAARDILLAWATTVSAGMLPNRFPDQGAEPEFNAVDASLWFVIAVHEYLEAARRERHLSGQDASLLWSAVDAILTGYQNGTRYGIHADTDGLLACGVPGVQLTWMDAKVGDWVVTPRIGKPVEIQALWLNALRIGSRHQAHWSEPFQRGYASFQSRFWNETRGMLYDVIDVHHEQGAMDASFRPNQILAVGGLPWRLLEGTRARRVVEVVAAHLWTPLGLRSLAPGEPGYTPHYQGGPRERDGAYHQGTAWPWLLGPFVEAWLHSHGNSPKTRREAHRRFLQPLLDHLQEAGLGHVAEIADADPPHTPRGCPWQAWSLGETLRLHHLLLGRSDRTVLEPPRRSTPKRSLAPTVSAR